MFCMLCELFKSHLENFVASIIRNACGECSPAAFASAPLTGISLSFRTRLCSAVAAIWCDSNGNTEGFEFLWFPWCVLDVINLRSVLETCCGAGAMAAAAASTMRTFLLKTPLRVFSSGRCPSRWKNPLCSHIFCDRSCHDCIPFHRSKMSASRSHKRKVHTLSPEY